MLRLITGRIGSGKTERVYAEIENLINSGSSSPVLIVPEQYSFETEKNIIRKLGAKKADTVGVYSFTFLSKLLFPCIFFNILENSKAHFLTLWFLQVTPWNDLRQLVSNFWFAVWVLLFLLLVSCPGGIFVCGFLQLLFLVDLFSDCSISSCGSGVSWLTVQM